MQTPKTVLSIAGSDSSSGAGIQADLKTIHAHDCYAGTAITGITAQNTMGVQLVEAVNPAMLNRQVTAILDDIGADAIKIGMLGTAENVKELCKIFDRYKPKHIVLDTVLLSTSGKALLQKDAIEVLRKELIPRVTIITPNIPEATFLLGKEIETIEKMLGAVEDLTNLGCKKVYLKGGHLNSQQLCDIYYDSEIQKHLKLYSTKVNSRNTHGTGCTLSSAIASNLAKGYSYEKSVVLAHKYIKEAIQNARYLNIGKGKGPLKHL